MKFPQELKDQLMRLNLSPENFANICIEYVRLKSEYSPFLTNRQFCELKGLFHAENNDPLFGSDEPIWQNQIYHVLNFLQMREALNLSGS